MIDKMIDFAETYFPDRKQQYNQLHEEDHSPGLSAEEHETVSQRMDAIFYNLEQYGASMTDICVSCQSVIGTTQVDRISKVTSMADSITRYLQNIREYALQDAGYYDLRAENSSLRKRDSGLRNIIDGIMVNLTEAQKAEIMEQLNNLPKTAAI